MTLQIVPSHHPEGIVGYPGIDVMYGMGGNGEGVLNTKRQSLIIILWKTYPTHPAGQNSRVYFLAVLINTSNEKSFYLQSLG